MPVVKGDKVKILRGTYKGKEGKVTEVYRKKWVIHVEGINRDKVNGSSAKVGQGGDHRAQAEQGP